VLRTSALARESVRHCWRHRLRTGLFVCCAGVGAAGVIVSVNFAAGGRQQVLDQIQRMGTNIVIVTALADRAKAGRARTGSIVATLRPSDYDAIRRDVGEVVRSSPLVSTALRLKGGAFSKVSLVIGCEPAYFEIKAWPMSDGTVFDDADMRRSARVALLGHTVASDLFGTASPIGERLFINRVPFVVGGVLSERGQGLDVANEDQQVYVPLTTVMRRLSNVDYFNAIALEIRRWNDMDRAAVAVTDLLNARHRSSVSRRSDFQVQNQKALVDTQLASSARLAFFVRWVGWSGLLVSGTGVLAMAWIAVRDRTTEIGTRRALGAVRTDVFLQFAVEAIVLTAVGSAVGLGLGWAGTRVVAARALLPFVFDRDAATLAIGSAFLINTACSAWPAYRAARLDPVVALRHE
jgi:putative ABC transport system permease protein